jgi:DNA-binding NarL/FixJ family response regulator
MVPGKKGAGADGMTRVRIVLADDHHLVRTGMRALLQSLPDVAVVGETGDGREAVDLVRAQAPNIVLMDIAMPGLNGLEATARIAKEFPQTRVIILSMHASEEYVQTALRAGAAGYLLKNAAPEELWLAIQAVMRGETWLSSAISRLVVEEYLGARGESTGSLAQLTPRQREILQLIAEGKTTKQIAAALAVSIKTVETHRAQLMERLGIHDVAGLVRYAIRHGLVRIDS